MFSGPPNGQYYVLRLALRSPPGRPPGPRPPSRQPTRPQLPPLMRMRLRLSCRCHGHACHPAPPPAHMYSRDAPSCNCGATNSPHDIVVRGCHHAVAAGKTADDVVLQPPPHSQRHGLRHRRPPSAARCPAPPFSLTRRPRSCPPRPRGHRLIGSSVVAVMPPRPP